MRALSPIDATCQAARSELQASLDARASSEAAQAHLASCASCREEAALLRELDTLLTNEPALEPPADFAASVLALVAEDARRSKRRARLAAVAVALAAASVVVGLNLAGVDLLQGGSSLVSDGFDVAARARDQAETLVSGARIAWSDLSALPGASLGSLLAAVSMPGALALAAVLAVAQLGWFRTRARSSREGSAAA